MPAARPSRLAALLGVPSPDQSDPTWHVSPVVDSLCYAWSWLWVLIPMVLVSGTDRLDYLGAYLVVLSFTDVHRHYGFPYVYLDGQVFRRHPIRFTVFPLLMLALFAASPFLARSRIRLDAVGVGAVLVAVLLLVQILRRDRDPDRPDRRALGFAALAGLLGGAAALAADALGTSAPALGALGGFVAASFALDLGARRAGRRVHFVTPILAALVAVGAVIAGRTSAEHFRPRGIIAFVAVVAGIWNIWHVYMQKYGILRLYQGKARPLREGRPDVPGWVDRLLLFAWLPLYLAVLPATYREEVFRLFPQGRATLGPVFDELVVIGPVLLPFAIGLVVASVVLFLRAEWRAHRLRSRARLVMAAGTVALASTFLYVHPLKAYLAFAFSHGLEYMVFVWAFQRRRYHEPLEHRPRIAAFLRFPFTVYVLSALLLAGLFLYWKYWGRWLVTEADQPRFLRYRAMEWVGYWTIFQSMVHFYFDGFLWKMRLPSVRQTVGARS
ncbi:MAG: hypothetical protein CMN30_03810 [Sandaracinus sp.]|nr:hypothetical protein [Sandaracinus sp.]